MGPAGAHPLAHASMQALQAVSAAHRVRDGIELESGEEACSGGEKKRALGEAPRVDVQYLCTGYDAFLSHEPCPM